MTQDTYPEISTQIIQSVLGVNRDQQGKSPFIKKDVQPSILQNLSSSMRVGSVKPAGFDFLLSDSLSNNVRRLDVTKRNLGDGMDMLMTAEDALAKIQNNLERMQELASEAANPLYTSKVRERLQKEADYLAREISVIEETAEFKGQKLLSKDAVAVTLQVGYQSYQTSRMTIGLDQGILGQLEKTSSTTTPYIPPATPAEPETGSPEDGQTNAGGSTPDAPTYPIQPVPGTGDTEATEPVGGGGSGSAGSGADSESAVISPEAPPATVAELATNAEIAAVFGWEVDSAGNIYTGQATADVLSDFWSGMTQRLGNGNNATLTATQALKDRLDLNVDYGLHHQYVSETFNINGVDVEYQFKVSFTGGTNSEGQQVVTDLKPTMSHEEEWQNGSPINVVLGDQQVAVRFNRNLNQNQSQNYNYLENARPGGFQNFGILTTDFRPLTVENIQETSTPAVEPPPSAVTDPIQPPVTDEQPATPADPVELPPEGNEPGSGDTGSTGPGSSSGGRQSGGGDAATEGSGINSGKTLLETILSSEAANIKSVDLSSNQTAKAALVSTTEAIDFVKNLRSSLEASVRELGSIMVGHETHSKVLTDSSERIQDAAIAQQTALQAQQQILEQTNLAVFGMANTDNRTVLSLLKEQETSFSEIPYQFPREEDQEKKEARQQVNRTAVVKEDEKDTEPLYQYPRATDEQAQHQLASVQSSVPREIA